ncbi:MAG: glycoside hydrolase family 38 C-terminal domain-containing protein [Anaerohalosphaeraceae bacterium]
MNKKPSFKPNIAWNIMLLSLLAFISLRLNVNGQTHGSEQKAIQSRADGVIQLDAASAVIHGQTVRYQVLEGTGTICCWTNADDWLEWTVAIDQPGEYVVEIRYSCEAGSQGSAFDIALGSSTLSAQIAEDTGTWYDLEFLKLGDLKAEQAGNQVLMLKPTRKPGLAVMNLVWLRLIPVADYASYLGRTRAERQPQPIPLPDKVFVVPNFHPASCGWLANWSVERNYCANSYLDHLGRVGDDAAYHFALSECNNMIAILNFQPDQFVELKQRITEGRVELVNGFFLESTINLSGGEALAKMGIEGLRWQREMMGAVPRFSWTIDVCGMHDQMPQLCNQLGLEALIYTRCNRTDKTIFWSISPDGTRILTLVPGHYSDNLGGAYDAKTPLTQSQLRRTAQTISDKLNQTPTSAPVLVLGGYGDYALAPPRKENPSEFLAQWQTYRPDCKIEYSTFSRYIDTLMPDVKAGKVVLPTIRAGTGYTFDSFWIENPRIKTGYRHNEHTLQAAEMMATVASLNSGFNYPVQIFYHAWLQMLLNMDRNTLWGSAGGMVFEHETSWDANDRLVWVLQHSQEVMADAVGKLAGAGEGITLFNAANWQRNDPQRWSLAAGQSFKDCVCEVTSDATILCQFDIPSIGLTGMELDSKPPVKPKLIELPQVIETDYYFARLDPASGVLTSLKLKSSDRELLGGLANVIVAEKHAGRGDPGDFTSRRPERTRLGATTDYPAALTVTEGPLTITAEATGNFYGDGQSCRLIRFYKHHPRIEFETELNDIPNLTVVVAEFPLAAQPTEIRRGIPFGFSRDDGWVDGIVPAVRWSDYAWNDGAVALLDRGLSGREITDSTPVVFLMNATDKYYGYPNRWLSGKGKHKFEYALVPHTSRWAEALIPRLAWEYNCPVILTGGCQAMKSRSFVATSDNVIVEAMRRDGSDIELRMVETQGLSGTAKVTLNLPHRDARLTNLVGEQARLLTGGPEYQFPIQPQQIISLRFQTDKPVASIQPLTQWDELVPPEKRAALHEYQPNLKGHPPRGY